VKLKSWSREIFKYLKKIALLIHSKKIDKLITKTQISGMGKPIQKFSICFVAIQYFWISLQYQSGISLQVKEFCLFV
jgi:hypothetical protein